MKIFSREMKNNCSSSSLRRISSSCLRSARVWSADARRMSLMVRNCGFRSLMTQQFGDMLTSQSVNLYRASSVLSDDTPGVRCTRISTLAAVRSSTLRTFIFPFSTARVILSMSDSDVREYGMSRITSVLLSNFSIFARTLTFPPRCPSL